MEQHHRTDNVIGNIMELLLLPNELLYKINLLRIIRKLESYRVVDDNQAIELRRKYSYLMSINSLQWRTFMNDVFCVSMITFDMFLDLLRNCNYNEQCEYLVRRSSQVSDGQIRNPTLLHERKLATFYTEIKSLLDDDAFREGNRTYLENVIEELNNKVARCNIDDDTVRLQFWADKLVLYFYLLTQTYSDVDVRLNILERMPDCTPRYIDRTLFDIVYHSSMAINCAAKGDHSGAEEHKSAVEYLSFYCLSPFLCMLKCIALLYMAGNQQLASENAYMQCIQWAAEFPDDERRVFITISKLQYAHTLLGIDWNFHVRDIREVSVNDIKKARDILAELETPLEKRRKLWFFICKGRRFELSDLELSKKNIRKALRYAKDHRDVHYIQEYIGYLSA